MIPFHTEQIGSTAADQAGGFDVAVEIPDSFSILTPQQFRIRAGGEASPKSADAPFTITG